MGDGFYRRIAGLANGAMRTPRGMHYAAFANGILQGIEARRRAKAEDEERKFRREMAERDYQFKVEEAQWRRQQAEQAAQEKAQAAVDKRVEPLAKDWREDMTQGGLHEQYPAPDLSNLAPELAARMPQGPGEADMTSFITPRSGMGLKQYLAAQGVPPDAIERNWTPESPTPGTMRALMGSADAMRKAETDAAEKARKEAEAQRRWEEGQRVRNATLGIAQRGLSLREEAAGRARETHAMRMERERVKKEQEAAFAKLPVGLKAQANVLSSAIKDAMKYDLSRDPARAKDARRWTNQLQTMLRPYGGVENFSSILFGPEDVPIPATSGGYRLPDFLSGIGQTLVDALPGGDEEEDPSYGIAQ